MIAAFFDVDGTLTLSRVWSGLLEYFRVKKKRRMTLIFFRLYHYPLIVLYNMGLIPVTWFRAIWAKHLSWFFRGYTVEEAKEIWDWVVINYINHNLREDVCNLLKEHRQSGHVVVLVSGGPQPLVERIGFEVGAKYALGTVHQIRNGRYTSRGGGPVCIDQFKAILTKQLISDEGLDINLESSYAYADSTGDIPLLEMVGNPVAVYPDREFRPIALERGWRIFPG